VAPRFPVHGSRRKPGARRISGRTGTNRLATASHFADCVIHPRARGNAGSDHGPKEHPMRENGAHAPDTPTDLPRQSWWAVLKRTVREFQDDSITDWAAALTYYGVLSIFPALL